MRKSEKYLVVLALVGFFISSNCLAQTKVEKTKVATVTNTIAAPKKVAVVKNAVVSKNIVTSKTVADTKVPLDPKKVVELQKSALKDGILNMSVVAETPLLPELLVVDSVALVKNLKVKPFKVNSHASYYHDKLNGKRTASGKPFDNKKFTAAHRTFPFGTQLRLTNTINNKSVLVVVNDRGPFTKSREIDITKAAFMQIATNKKSGSVNITIEVVQ